MTRLSTRPKVDRGLVLCLLLTLFLALPLMRNAGLPNSAETLLHVADDGLADLLASIIQGIFSLGAQDTGRGLLLLCFALGSGGMYAFCKRRSGRLGALIAGLVYVYSPYLMFGAPYARGAYGELLALALFPLLLWRVDALRDRPQSVSFLLLCLLQGALLHAHLATALTLTSIAFRLAPRRDANTAYQSRSQPDARALRRLGWNGAAAWLARQLVPLAADGGSGGSRGAGVPRQQCAALRVCSRRLLSRMPAPSMACANCRIWAWRNGRWPAWALCRRCCSISAATARATLTPSWALSSLPVSRS